MGGFDLDANSILAAPSEANLIEIKRFDEEDQTCFYTKVPVADIRDVVLPAS